MTTSSLPMKRLGVLYFTRYDDLFSIKLKGS
jgi:hypothetical protein